MKKKIFAVMMAAAMALSMVACGGSSSSSAPAETKTEGTESTAAEAPAEAVKSDLKIGLVTDTGGVNDQSFNQSAWAGLQQFAEETGAEVNYLESKGDSDYVPNISAFIDDEYDLIICVGYQLANALNEQATANPDQKFAIIDDSTNADLDNVTCLMFKQEEASYLVGYVAGKMTQTNTVGIVLGMATETMNLFGYGYAAGVIDANPDATVLQANVNSFGDAAGGKSAANTMISQGADIVFHAAGQTGVGVIEGCKEAGKMAIGVDQDQAYLAPETIITSAMKRVDVSVLDVCRACADGTLAGGVKTYSLENEGVGIAPTQDLLPEELVAEIADVQAKILAGEIKVPDGKDAFEAAYGDIYELD